MTTPYMSIVVISYNGAATLGRTLKSLIAQDYPSHHYEIIVVDDGSTDTTRNVAAEFPVKYVYQTNAGIPAARNAGLAVARGDILVTFDDDTMAYPDFLTQLASGYATGQPLGVGGCITEPTPLVGVVAKYINATGTGTTGAQPRPGLIGRFISYLEAKLHANSGPLPDIQEVGELYGANGSYPMPELTAIGGWDARMSSSEDRDLSYRLKAAFPGRPIIAVTAAKLIHDPKLSLTGYLLRPWKRGPKTLEFHQKNNLVPPFFPFPFVVGLAVSVTAILAPIYLALAVLLAPLICYFWWPVRMIREHRPLYIAFCYLQLAEESLVIAGLMRGYMQKLGERYE